ncbi:penicillin-binding protein 1C [Campylobacterota bacterium]|nr:penicillin-binding protein 1C [Campylobacterota bacterium]
MIALLAALVFAASVVRLLPHPPPQDGLFFSTAYYDRNGGLLRLTLAKDDRYRVWTPLNEIGETVISGSLLQEDRYFYLHFGFNPFSLVRGGWISFVRGGAKQGGSTITMQLARMYWKMNTKSIGGKIRQILRAVQLELLYSKDEILEGYLNYAPYGRNIEGVGAASLIYFDKQPNALALPEALTLSVLPQSPTFRIDKNTGLVGEKLTIARNGLFEKYAEAHDTGNFNRSFFHLPLALRQPEELPFRAPHLVEQLAKESFAASEQPTAVRTTIDPLFQKLLETQIGAFVDRNRRFGITNAAAVLVDTSSMQLVAAVGSANYFDDTIAGQINGFNIKRSPGSALKPFIYALAIDQGLIHQQTVLKDVPSSFGAYEPENFDRAFLGPLSATQALIRSRNVPAVYLSNRLRFPSLHRFLKLAGVSRLRSEKHYGLALALGGGEITALEIAKLYALLANGGRLREIQTTIGELQNDESPDRLISAEASFITLDMLAQTPPYGSGAAAATNDPIYWKTGTSRSFKDAWSVGLVGQYALVVWIGNFDNSGNPAFVGAQSAAPLFFQIAHGLKASAQISRTIAQIPPNLKQVEVCLSSGDLATVWCKRKGVTWFIPGVSPIRVDTVYRPVRFNAANGRVLCDGESAPTVRTEVFEFYSSDILALFRRAGLPKREPPSLAHCMSNANASQPPAITSPLRNTIYTIRASKNGSDEITLSATGSATVKTFYWFANDRFIGKSERSSPLSWLPLASGRYQIRVIDDHGQVDVRLVDVALGE